MSEPLVLVDLDRTLIYSRAALGTDPPALTCVEQHKGRDASFMTQRASEQLSALRLVATFVPCTTRTRKQFARVTLPAPALPYAIAANGGHLLVDGHSDADWHRRVRRRLAESAPLQEVRARLTAPEHAAWLLRDRVAEDLFCYAIVQRDALADDTLAELTEWSAQRGWAVSLQGRKLYFVPRSLTKSAAAAELQGRLGSGVVLAAGDSLLDTDLLRYADLAIRPAHSELETLGWTIPGLHVTRSAGVRAGEELLDWLVAQAGAYREARA